MSSKSAVSDSSRAERKSVSSNGRLYLVVTTEAMGAAEEALLSAAARAALPGGKARPFVALAGLGG